MGEESQDEVQEVLIGKGIGGALRYLRDRGDLKETAVDWGGRNMDKKKSKLVGIVDESNNVVGKRDILLDRVDEFGRTMTPKEAFRQFSHKFHGNGPGKTKQAKRQKQFQEELKQKQMNTSGTSLTTMGKIRDLQAKLQSPYLVLSGHDVKPGQTSDPRIRSGFATAKKLKEPMIDSSSLTPMLDDNQTRDLQGIKRREPESGLKHPDPPPTNKKPNAPIDNQTHLQGIKRREPESGSKHSDPPPININKKQKTTVKFTIKRSTA